MIRNWSLSLRIGIFILALVLIACLSAPLITPYGPNDVDPGALLEAPSAAHWAGTDQLGRDLFARILYGGRASLGVAAGITIIALGGGALLGCAIGLLGGWTETLAMRIVDILLAIPSIVIAIAVAAAVGPGLFNLTVILGSLGVPFYVRLFRGETVSLRERPFVRAARGTGAGFFRLLRVQILPNVFSLFVTLCSNALGGALLAASALSFIGLGAQPPMAEWGALIFEGRNSLMYEWWCAVLPGVAVVISALGFILVGNGIGTLIDRHGDRP
jgi:peptide/nickel transport system permease protein